MNDKTYEIHHSDAYGRPLLDEDNPEKVRWVTRTPYVDAFNERLFDYRTVAERACSLLSDHRSIAVFDQRNRYPTIYVDKVVGTLYISEPNIDDPHYNEYVYIRDELRKTMDALTPLKPV